MKKFIKRKFQEYTLMISKSLDFMIFVNFNNKQYIIIGFEPTLYFKMLLQDSIQRLYNKRLQGKHTGNFFATNLC